MDPKAEPPVPPPDPMAEGLIPRPDGAVMGQPANAPAPQPPLNKNQAARQDLLVTMILIGAAMVVFGVIVGLAKLWARRQADDCDSPTTSLSSFREMYENGELSEVEYQQIRDKMATKMKGHLGIRPPAPAPPGGGSVGSNGTPPTPENPA
jgi:hypothetical protein